MFRTAHSCSLIRSWAPQVTFLLAAFLPCPVMAEERNSVERALRRISISDLKKHCGTLASDAFEGREAGSTGGHAAAAYLQTELLKVPGLEKAGVNGWTQEFHPNYRNVLAALPGSDPTLRREIIVIGAHYDHVGRGNLANSEGPLGYIHNGADDNASGTAALLELADAFASLAPAPPRTILFAFWDAEEAGLLGSQHWVAHPTRPIKDVRLDVNIDMLGRLREGRVIVAGWRSAAGLRSRLSALNPLGDLDLQFQPSVIADSDHYAFYRSGIPAVHFDSGKHDDYHRPTDDADKLNYAGLHRLTEFVFRLVHSAATEPSLPGFRREAVTETPPRWVRHRPEKTASRRLGVVFDLEPFRENRAIVTEVASGSPADRAGLRIGDQILKLAHWERGDVADLRTIVQIAKNPVAICVKRSSMKAPIDLNAELPGDPVRVGIGWQMDTAIPDAAGITEVVPDSPADRAGLKVGDVIESLEGIGIKSDEDLRHRLLAKPGPLRLRVERNGRTSDVTVPLFEAPSRQP